MESESKIGIAQDVFAQEISVLYHIKNSLKDTFVDIENEIVSCQGKIVLCGMGKSGHIARKISATLASLGSPSFFLHPAEAMHGDLGMVSEKDIIIMLSNSGETREILSIIPSLKLIGVKLIGLTGNKESTLAKECDIVQVIDIEREACYLNLAPTSSTTAMLVYGDALAVVASEEIGFTKSDFGVFHPAGTLGKKVLMRVRDIMAKGGALPIVIKGCMITEAIVEMSKKGLGTVAIADRDNKLVGLLTDGDLRRAIEKKVNLYEDVVDSIMTKTPKYIRSDLLLVDALKLLKENRLNNYPIVDEELHVIGMLTWQMIIREGIAL